MNRTYRVYLHGEFVAVVQAMTKGEAVTKVANKHYNRNEYGLMAVQG
jgi:hypothetical protein